MTTEVINTEKLTKNFGKFCAVGNLSLNVQKGEIYGFLGLNGAGKTTTIRMLLGMIQPSSGSAYLFGEKVTTASNSIWNKVGYLVETPYSYPDLTVIENLELIRRLRLIKNRNLVNDIIDKLKLSPYHDRKAKDLSLGNAQRLGIAKALMHHPEILILDEPSNGLDPAGIVEIREILKDLAENQGVTIFISSHILGEISKLATRIGIIHNSILIQESSVDELDKMRKRCLHFNAKNLDNAILFFKKQGYTVLHTGEEYAEITGKNALENPDEIASLLVKNGFPPTLLKVHEEDLESYFLRTIKNGGIL